MKTNPDISENLESDGFEEVKVDEDVNTPGGDDDEMTKHYEMFIIVNPRSGARKGTNLLKKYGGGSPKHMTIGEKTANILLFDVTTQGQTILESVKVKLQKI